LLSAGISIRSICIYHNGFNVSIGVLEGILLGRRKKFALKLTICPKNNQCALKLTFFNKSLRSAVVKVKTTPTFQPTDSRLLSGQMATRAGKH